MEYLLLSFLFACLKLRLILLLFAILRFVAYISSKNIIVRVKSDIFVLLYFEFGQQNKI